jgi:hypothetical protein
MPHFPVFTSYAQADREKHLEEFVTEFREQLGGLFGQVDRTTILFFDRDGVKAGDAWNETIIDAVRHAKVLICLMSPTYFGREWCGRELEMFSRRSGGLNLPDGASVRFISPSGGKCPSPHVRFLPNSASIITEMPIFRRAMNSWGGEGPRSQGVGRVHRRSVSR